MYYNANICRYEQTGASWDHGFFVTCAMYPLPTYIQCLLEQPGVPVLADENLFAGSLQSQNHYTLVLGLCSFSCHIVRLWGTKKKSGVLPCHGTFCDVVMVGLEIAFGSLGPIFVNKSFCSEPHLQHIGMYLTCKFPCRPAASQPSPSQ